jgi:hypothetical protein
MVATTGFEPNNRGSGQSRISLKTIMLSGISLGGVPTAVALFRPFLPSPLENVRKLDLNAVVGEPTYHLGRSERQRLPCHMNLSSIRLR